MKKTKIILVLASFYFTGVILADKTGVGAERGQDRTGSPVGSVQQCGQCHSGGNFNASVTTILKDTLGNIVTEYLAGEKYIFEVEVGGSSPKFGFQSVALLSNNSNAGTLTAQSSNTKITTLSAGRLYGEHTAASTSNLFVMEWIAPIAGSGDVKFYSAGNCVNGNNSSNGDQATLKTQITITESPLNSIRENEVSNISIFPNPSSSFVNIQTDESKNFNIQMFSLDGKLVLEKSNINQSILLNVEGFEKGNYILKFSGDVNSTKVLSLN